MTRLTERGPFEIMVRDSRTASVLAEHANAARTYRDTGDAPSSARCGNDACRSMGSSSCCRLIRSFSIV